MKSFRAQSIGRQVALGTALLLPLALGVSWSVNRALGERSREVGQEAALVAETASAYFDQSLRGFDSTASALAHDPSLMRMSRATCDRLLAEILRDQPLLLNAVLQDPDGQVRGSGLPSAAGRLPALLPYVTRVIETRRPAISDLTVGPLTQKPSIVFGYPVVAADSSMLGVLSLELDLLTMESVLKDVPLPQGSVVTLTAHEGLVLARSREADRYIGTTVTVPKASERGESPQTERITDADGRERIVASALVRRGPWTMSVGIPANEAAARLRPMWRRDLVIVAGSLIVALLWSMWMGGHLSHELNSMRAAAGRIADGDLSPIHASRPLNRELSELEAQFQTMAEKLHQARQTLAEQIEQERRTRAALETLQRHLVRQERLATVGLLVSGVAHELNNPLQAIMGASELLERRRGLTADALTEVALVKTQSQRASEIIRRLSRFSTQQPAEPEVVDVRDVVREVVQLRRAELASANIRVESDTRSTGSVHANFTELEQVVLNFVINAQQAVQSTRASHGRVVIRSLDVDGRVRVEVVDNGPGVGPDDEAKLFQPFFTTKPVGRGTGLGLSVSHGIVDSYGGSIGYSRSETGESVFYFELPRVDPTNG